MSEHAPWWLTHIAGPIRFTSFGAVLGFPWAFERLIRRFCLLPLEDITPLIEAMLNFPFENLTSVQECQ